MKRACPLSSSGTADRNRHCCVSRSSRRDKHCTETVQHQQHSAMHVNMTPMPGCPRGPTCVQVLYLDGDSLWLDDPRELWKHFDDMHGGSAVWGLVEEAAAGRNWYTEGGWQWTWNIAVMSWEAVSK